MVAAIAILVGAAVFAAAGTACAQESAAALPIDPSQARTRDAAPAGAAEAGAQQVGDPSSIENLAKKVDDIRQALGREDPDFALVLGLGSTLLGKNVTDYQNQSNVLGATALGRATPQLLAGVSFRTKVPSALRRFRGDCSKCETWERHPWNAFVSIKFSPGSSQTISGYVIGGSFAIAKHLNVLVGYSLTPVNEPAPGLRNVASALVRTGHDRGQLTSFDPNALAAAARNAFDGFPLTDSADKLIYPGEPLTVHYRGSVLIGVSFPVYFRSALSP